MPSELAKHILNQLVSDGVIPRPQAMAIEKHTTAIDKSLEPIKVFLTGSVEWWDSEAENASTPEAKEIYQSYATQTRVVAAKVTPWTI